MPRPLAGALVAAALLVAVTGCGTGAADVTTTDPRGGPAGADRSGAEARVAAFTCPARARHAGARRTGPRAGERLLVVTTVAPLTSIAANVAGDRADVRGLVPEGTDSHTYEPKPSVAATLARADVVVANGLGLEDPTLALADDNLGPEGQVVELGTLALDRDQRLYDRSFPADAGRPNPHLWTNPPMARCYALTLASVLARADPGGAEVYRRNAAAYAARLDELDRLMVAATATVPPAHRRLLTYHDAYAYFAARYGWEVLGAVQVSSFEDPGPKEVVALIEQVRDEGVPAVFGSEVFPSDVLEEIAGEAGATYVDVLRDDDLPGEPGDPDHSFLGLLQFDFVTLVEHLGGDPTDLAAFDPSDVAPDRAVYPG